MDSSALIPNFIRFLECSPTGIHAVTEAAKILSEAGFLELKESEKWKIEPGKKYFTVRNESSLCAFVTPSRLPEHLVMLASHTDSPGFKLKPNPEIRSDGVVSFSFEIYGSPLLTSWLNRDLGLAGRILFEDNKGVVRKQTIVSDRFPLTIAQLAVHLDRDVNEKGALPDKQKHFNAIVGPENAFEPNVPVLEQLIRAQFPVKTLKGHDLFLYPLEKPRFVGYNDSLLASYRIDNLSGVHSSLNALLQQSSPSENEIKMTIFWDHEETGSYSAQGACSPFFMHTLERIVNAYGGVREDFFRLLDRSLCISIDSAHAVHPNYGEKHDPCHRPLLGGGIVVKSNARQKYATSAPEAFAVEKIAEKCKVRIQRFVSRNDLPCGSTVGPLVATGSGISVVDIGVPQLSMHGCRELMACQDHVDMCKLTEGLFSRPIQYSK